METAGATITITPNGHDKYVSALSTLPKSQPSFFIVQYFGVTSIFAQMNE
jgi:uncharacterized protein Veg